eukprot:TRINITY_DN26613_c0_g1_i1.p1 TRINITY_DN26613_c0_g1~~TRINITY_DN26613_c0_g1_i1.p1  ORF type:complete len:115 (+),score=26.89 TRINITY_DN26613_c0_g1_i1:263-607(+)
MSDYFQATSSSMRASSLMVLGALVAFFVLASICIFRFFGVASLPSDTCVVEQSYSACSAIQDLRSFVSFVIGSAVCWLVSAGNNEAEGFEDNEDDDHRDEGHSHKTLQLVTCFW